MSLKFHQTRIETSLCSFIEKIGEKNRLRDACEYALLSGGKRLRPLLVLATADALGYGLDVMPAALSSECFHTASLIADDLPSMDDDDLRRDRPSLHKVFGEGTAILASYTLIAEGYGGIYRNEAIMQKGPLYRQAAEAAHLALKMATHCGGMRGATNGQYLDLFPPDGSWKTIEQVILQKTITLFQLSFAFGWLFGGGDPRALGKVEQCAYHLGLSFQIQDDLEDFAQDQKKKNSINTATCLGRTEAEVRLEKELVALQKSLEELGLWTPLFQELYRLLSRRGRDLFCDLRAGNDGAIAR